MWHVTDRSYLFPSFSVKNSFSPLFGGRSRRKYLITKMKVKLKPFRKKREERREKREDLHSTAAAAAAAADRAREANEPAEAVSVSVLGGVRHYVELSLDYAERHSGDH